MSDANSLAGQLRERLGAGAEDRLGRALSELLENPLVTAAIGRAFDAREIATQAQEAALGALNIPSAADIERLTRRLRSVSQRLEGIEDGVDRLDRGLAPGAEGAARIDRRLQEIERRLQEIERRLTAIGERLEAGGGAGAGTSRKRARGAGRRTQAPEARAEDA